VGIDLLRVKALFPLVLSGFYITTSPDLPSGLQLIPLLLLLYILK
jgi:hypothetical protein